MTKPWHICIVWAGTRAFVRPETLCDAVVLWVRGWRRHPYNPHWWTKARLFDVE